MIRSNNRHIDRLCWQLSDTVITFVGTIVDANIVGELTIVGKDQVMHVFEIDGTILKLNELIENQCKKVTSILVASTERPNDVAFWKYEKEVNCYTRIVEISTSTLPNTATGMVKIGTMDATGAIFTGYCWIFSIMYFHPSICMEKRIRPHRVGGNLCALLLEGCYTTTGKHHHDNNCRQG